MITLSDLKAKAQKNPLDKNIPSSMEDITLSVDDDNEVGVAIRTLFAYFGEDDRRQAVRLEIQGNDAGYIKRNELYDFVVRINKGEGIGSGDISTLTGDPRFLGLRLLHYRCPIEDCSYHRKELDLGKTKTIKCKIHPEKDMVIPP